MPGISKIYVHTLAVLFSDYQSKSEGSDGGVISHWAAKLWQTIEAEVCIPHRTCGHLRSIDLWSVRQDSLYETLLLL